jgi:hypothetical protein
MGWAFAAALGFVGVALVAEPDLVLLSGLLIAAAIAAGRPQSRPALVGVLIVTYLNGVPGIDLSMLGLPAGLRYDDIILGVLWVFGVAWTRSATQGSSGRLVRSLTGIFVAYWLLIVLFTALFGGVSAYLAALYGRDLLAMGIALAVIGAYRNERATIVLLAVVVAAEAVYTGAHLLHVVAGLDTSAITHPYMLGSAANADRLYARIDPLAVVAFVFSLGMTLHGPTGHRMFFRLGVFVAGVELVLQFTRANYIGLAVALLAGAAMVGLERRQREFKGRAAVSLLVAAAVAVAGWIASGASSVQRLVATNPYAQRILSAQGEISGLSGTLGYRVGLYATMLGILGSRWLTGLGFLHPAAVYVGGLPQGALRNSDTGVLGVVMTMGVVGLALIASPLIAMAVRAPRILREGEAYARALAWSLVLYAVWALVTAFSLSFLSHGNGLACTALAVGMAASAYDNAKSTASPVVEEV